MLSQPLEQLGKQQWQAGEQGEKGKERGRDLHLLKGPKTSPEGSRGWSAHISGEGSRELGVQLPLQCRLQLLHLALENCGSAPGAGVHGA